MYAMRGAAARRDILSALLIANLSRKVKYFFERLGYTKIQIWSSCEQVIILFGILFVHGARISVTRGYGRPLAVFFCVGSIVLGLYE